MKKYFIFLLTMVLLVSLVLGGCGTSTTVTETKTATTTATQTVTQTVITTTEEPPPPTGPIYGGTLIMLSDVGITNINPPGDAGSLLTRALLPCLEPLLRIDENGVLVGHLAESWDVSPDGTAITFHIQQGVMFHDGTPLNAEAVKYSLEATALSGLWGVGALNFANSYDIVDEYTLRANLDAYNYGYMTTLATLAGLIASPTAMEKETTPENLTELHMVGTGPFIYDSFKENDFVKYTKNPNYWQEGLPYLDAVIIRHIVDRTVGVMAFQAGEVDVLMTGLQKATSEMLVELGYNVYTYPLRFHFAMSYDSAEPSSPFADKMVREALHYGVDKQTLVNGLGGGSARGFEPLYQMAEPGDPWYCPELPIREYDLAKAKQLLADAGYPSGFEVTLISDTFAEMNFLEALQGELIKMGLDVTLDIADMGRITDLEYGGWTGMLHPGFPTSDTVAGLNGRWGDPAFLISMYKPEGWSDMWAAVMSEPDDDTRTELMKEIVRLDYNECVTFTWRADAPFGIDSGNVHGVTLHAGGAMDMWWPEGAWKDAE